MRAVLIIGIVLVVIGAVALVYGGFSYSTREEVVDVGPLEITREERRAFPISPLVGGVLLAGGIVLVAIAARGRSMPA